MLERRSKVGQEWFRWPSEAKRDLELLNEAFNQIQNAALGKGTRPLVGAALAETVVKTVSRFKRWRSKLQGITWIPAINSDINDWQRRADELSRRVGKALGKPRVVPLLQTTKPGIAASLASVSRAVVWVSVAVLALQALRKR